ncbi:MAG: nucleotidyltransferase family protein [Candidatus Latescibacteria bacterium]|nr:nucleotidyltransferase family protein [Candidatus Latescibacterota bacterium]
MKAIVIAAGYATRLYPLTKNFPKGLLKVGGRAIMDYLMDQIASVPGLDGVYLITNSRFAGHFERWSAGWNGRLKIDVIDDGTTTNENRLGAVGDIRFAVRARSISDDVLVCGSDNLFRFRLKDLVADFHDNPVAHICVCRVDDPKDRRRRGIAVLDEENRVVRFSEKPAEPESCWGSAAFYVYPASTLKRFDEYVDSGRTTDAPGHFVEWLCHVEPVYAHRLRGTAIDIGSPETLEQARREYEKTAGQLDSPW